MYQSFYSLLFVALQARIQEQVPEIRWVDLDTGQLESYDIRPAVAWPCVLIDFPASQFTNESQLVQWGDVNIELRLGFPEFSQSSNTAPVAVKEKALKFFELESKLYKALQGWAASDQEGETISQPLIRLQVATEKREDAIRVRSMVFTTAFQDASAQPEYTVATPNLQFDLGE